MLSESLKNLNTVEIREAIMKTNGEEKLFYVQLFNHVMKLRREETLKTEQEQGNYNRKENYLRQGN